MLPPPPYEKSLHRRFRQDELFLRTGCPPLSDSSADSIPDSNNLRPLLIAPAVSSSSSHLPRRSSMPFTSLVSGISTRDTFAPRWRSSFANIRRALATFSFVVTFESNRIDTDLPVNSSNSKSGKNPLTVSDCRWLRWFFQ